MAHKRMRGDKLVEQVRRLWSPTASDAERVRRAINVALARPKPRGKKGGSRRPGRTSFEGG